jgi:hypothetical protein
VEYLPLAPEDMAEDVLQSLYALAGPPTRTDAALQRLFGLGAGPRVDPAVLAALKSPEPARVAAAALIVGSYGDAAGRRRVERLLADDSATVRLRAAQGLLLSGERKAVPALIAMLGKGPLALAREAEELLVRAAGKSAPQAGFGEDDKSRAAVHEAWRRWWDGQAASFRPAVEAGGPLAGGGQLARRATQRFLDHIRKNDVKGLLQLADVPFVIDSVMTLDTRANLEDMLRQMKPPEPFHVEIKRVERLDSFLKQAPRHKETVKLFEKARMWVVNVESKEGGRVQEIGVLVRVRGAEARVVGFALRGELK